MPVLPTRSFATIVQSTVAGIQGRCQSLIDFSTGSPLRAIVEGFGGLFLWLQAMALQVLQAARLSTSQGNDVDSFTADFMPVVAGTASPRLGPQVASGQITYSRFTAGPSAILIPVGSTVQTNDGTQNFSVTADPTFVTFSAAQAGYVLAAGVANIIVPAQAQVAGSAGNVSPGQITRQTSSIQGIDTVVNLAAFTNGSDSESDGSLKSRFAAYILGLSRGDVFGLTASILGAAVKVQWKLVESYNLDGSWNPGTFLVIADDGSGEPSAAFLQIIQNAAYAVRPLAIQCLGAFPPTIIWATVGLQITTLPGYDHPTVVGLVANAIADNINAMGLGNPLPFSILAGWAYAVPGVSAVSAVTLNGSSGDASSLIATRATQNGLWTIPYGTIKAAAVNVS